MSHDTVSLPIPESVARPAAVPRVLVVDDVQDNREVLTRRLVRRGVEVAEASGGLAALEAIKKDRFDLVLLDIMMPDLSGNLVLQAIRAEHSPIELPVIMVSAKSESRDIVRCLEDGANDYVTKPVDFAVAFARIQTQLDRKREADKARAVEETIEAQMVRQQDSLAENEEQIRFLAFHDALTGLPNRAAFRDELAAIIANGDTTPAVLLFIDLDKFKAVNDTRGHETGDGVLLQAARRIGGAISAPSMVGRLGGDEFAVLLRGDAALHARSVAEEIVARLRSPFYLETETCEIGASCGLVPLTGQFANLDEALNAADIAMYAAKRLGRNRVEEFHDDMLEMRRRRQELEVGLRTAIRSHELELHFQPLFAAESRKLVSFEALVRWRHPTKGLIPPDQFIPIAEETGLITTLGEWVLREAMTEATFWPEDIAIAVNVSPLQIPNGKLLPTLVGTLATTGLAPNRLEIEITESSILILQPETLDFLRSVRELGVRVSIDDFGTGYSSMTYLQNFRFDKIKIDRSFVQAISDGAKNDTVIRAMLNLGATLGLRTTAEGVENLTQLEYLVANGCNEVQGFFFSKPMDRVATLKFIAENR